MRVSIDRQRVSNQIDHIAMSSRSRSRLLIISNTRGAHTGFERDYLIVEYLRLQDTTASARRETEHWPTKFIFIWHVSKGCHKT